MSNPFFKGDEEKQPRKPGGVLITLTTAMFFGRDGKTIAYDTPEEFLKYGKSLTDPEAEDLTKFFSLMKDGLKSDGGSRGMVDRAGRQYIYYRFYRPKSQPGCKVIAHGSMIRLHSDYSNGLYAPNFTLLELIEEAEREV